MYQGTVGLSRPGLETECNQNILYLTTVSKPTVKYIWNKVVPIILFFSSCQILPHPIRNFRSKQRSQGRFDKIGSVSTNVIWLGRGANSRPPDMQSDNF